MKPLTKEQIHQQQAAVYGLPQQTIDVTHAVRVMHRQPFRLCFRFSPKPSSHSCGPPVRQEPRRAARASAACALQAEPP